MKRAALGDLVVEVLHNRGDQAAPDWSVGSGFLVDRRLVLTACHNVGSGEILVRLHGEEERGAEVCIRGGEFVDLALLKIGGAPIGAARPRYGVVDRDTAAVIEQCWAVGFPRFKERAADPKPLRFSAQVDGEIPTGENLGHELLTLRVTSDPRPLAGAESAWSGMSGAAVFAGEVIVGVVTEHHLPEGENSLAVVPLTAIDELGEDEAASWWQLLGVERADQLVRLPRDTLRPPAYRATIEDLAPAKLVGRERELADLAAFATGRDGYRWQVGGPWTGKTALAAHFVRTCPPQVDAVAYFLVSQRSDADSGRFLQAVNDQLAHLLGEQPERRDDPDVFRELWARTVQQAEATGRHLLLVVDGLDEDLGPSLSRPSVAQLIPGSAGGHAHVLVSSRRYPQLSEDVAAGHPLWTVERVELAQSPVAAELERRARQDLNQLLGRREVDSLVGDLLGLLTAAQGPLSVDDLTTLAKLGDPTVRRPWVSRIVEQNIARVLEVTESTDEKRFAFAHTTLRTQAEAKFGASELYEYRQRLHAWADSYRLDRWSPDKTPRYLFDTYPTVLFTTEPDRLDYLYGDFNYLEGGIQTLGVDRIAADLRTASSAEPTGALLSQLSRLLDREAHHLRSPNPLSESGYITRQLCLQALESGLCHVAQRARERLASLTGPQLLPQWTRKRTAGGLVRILEGHTGSVRAVAVSPDGTRAVSGADDKTVRVWDLATGALTHTLKGHTGLALAVALSPDGARAMSGSADGTVRVWALATGALVRTLEGPTGWMLAMALSPEGTQAMSSGYGSVQMWDLAEGKPARTLDGQTRLVRAVAPSADGTRAVSGAEDGTVQVWDLATGELMHALEGHTGRVWAIAVSADGTRAVSGGGDRTVRIWDLTMGKLVRTAQGHTSRVRAIAPSADGTRAVSGADDGTVRVWDLATGEVVRTVEGSTSPVWAAAMSADGTRAVTGGGYDGKVRVWDLTTGELIHTLKGHTESVWAAAMSGDGTRAMSGGGYEGRVRVWDLTRGKAMRTLKGHIGPVRAVAMSADGTRAVSGGGDRTVRAWNLATGELMHTLKGHTDSMWAVAMSADGTRAVSGGGDRTVRAWNLATGELMHTLKGHTRPVWAVAMSADGTRAVSSGGDRTIRIWDFASGLCLNVLSFPSVVRCIASVNRGSNLALFTGDDATAVTLYILTTAPGTQ